MSKRIDITPIKTTYHVSDGKREIYLEVDSLKGLKILNENEDGEFVFEAKNNPATLEKWETVARLLTRTIKFIKEQKHGKKL